MPCASRLRRAVLLWAALFVLGLVVAPSAGAFVYWPNWGAGSGTTIGRANLDGSGANQSFITGANGPCGVAADSAHIYWANLYGGTIGRANLDGSGADQNFITGANGPCGVAVDSAHVYWANFQTAGAGGGTTIGRANLDGSGADQNFISGASGPCGVTVDSAHVFWANYNSNTIGRANLDGSGADQSFITGTSGPCSVTVDSAHAYWGNCGSGCTGTTIGRANLDGSGADQSFVTGASGPCAVGVDGAHLYWGNSSTIGRANLDGSGADQSFITGASAPCGEIAVDPGGPLRQITAANPQDCAGNIGLAFDGTDLLMSCSTNVIDKIRASDGSLAGQITVAAEVGEVLGASSYDRNRGKLWVCTSRPFPTFNKVILVDPADGSEDAEFTSNGCQDGLAYDGSDDTLWASPDAGCTVTHYKTDGSVIAAFNACPPTGGNSGIAVGGAKLYLADPFSNQVYQVEKDFSASSLFFQSDAVGGVEDLECDDVTFAPKTAIWIMGGHSRILTAVEAPADSCGAQPLQCGDTITQDTILTADIVCPDSFTGTALTIAANDVTLNLAGHSIRAGANGGLAGVSDNTTLSRVQVLSGRIEGFTNGVSLGAVDSQIRRLAISATVTGISISGDGSGAGLDNCQRAVTNCVVRNVVDVPTASGHEGITMSGDGSHAYGNTVRGGPGYGIVVQGDKPRVNLNRVLATTCCMLYGISVGGYSTYAIVWNNTVGDPTVPGSGCSAGGFLECDGITVGAGAVGGNARVRLNHVTQAGYGIHVSDRRAFIASNDSSGNRADGINVGPVSETEGAANVVQQNNADNNSQYGINAAPGTIDGGGNTASGNGNPQQCVNVTCTP